MCTDNGHAARPADAAVIAASVRTAAVSVLLSPTRRTKKRQLKLASFSAKCEKLKKTFLNPNFGLFRVLGF